MPHLIAQGPLPRQRWRRPLEAERRFVVGRSAGAWSVAWDDHVSSQHLELCYRRGKLEVVRLGSGRNPVFVQGRQREKFSIRPGEHFVVGSTSFLFVDDQVRVAVDAPGPVTELTFSREYLQRLEFRDAAARIDALCRLPDVIANASSDEELCSDLVGALLAAVRSADFIAVVSLAPAIAGGDQADSGSAGEIDLRHWDTRVGGQPEFAPSGRLIRAAIDSGASIVHTWGGAAGDGSAFTQIDEVDWAFCTPVPGEACRGWAIYVAGSRAEATGPGAAGAGASARAGEAHDRTVAAVEHDLHDDLKFTELAANTLGSLRQLRRLERHRAALSQFISPVVLASISERDPELALAPRPADVTVLFCDLRGFSRTSEEAAGDLMGLLKRVSLALGVMTRQILEQGGVVGDFHGDAAMGFWGWPLAQDDAAERACRAALGIRREFAQAAGDRDHPLHDFRVGVGIAGGSAVAGKIGTVDQVKVTVFGPVVNLASRMENMTKTLQAPILVDERTAAEIRSTVPRTEMRLRRVARVQPFGLQIALEVAELLPPAGLNCPLSDADIATYEAGLDALQAGDWDHAFACLHRVPAGDRVKDFLTVFIAQHHRSPPAGWQGVIALDAK